MKKTSVLLFKNFFERCEKTLSPYLKFRNIKKDVTQWILDVFQADTGFFWCIPIIAPVVGNVYRVSIQKQKQCEDGWLSHFSIFDCRGALVTENEIPSQTINIKVLSVQGARCNVELCETNSRTPSQEQIESVGIFYSSQGTTILLDNFFGTGMLQAVDAWPNEQLPINYLLRMPTDDFLWKNSFPVVPRIVSDDHCYFYIPCTNCNGAGSVTCKKCNGSREVKCRSCGGTGDYHSNRGHIYTCKTCDGSGTVECPACNGNGSFECWVCKGSRQQVVRPDFQNNRFTRYKDEKTKRSNKDVFLYDPENDEEIRLTGFWEALKNETLKRFNHALLIEKRRQKLYADGQSVLACLQRKLDLTPADNEPPIQVVFSADVPPERIRKHAIYELSIQGRYNWLKKRIPPWPENTPVCFCGIDFESDKADDILFCGVDFEKRTLKIAISSKYNIAPIKNGVQRIRSSAPVPPEKREMQYLSYWLDRDSDTVFEALAKGVSSEEYPISRWFNNRITRYPSQISAVKQGVSDSPILLLQGPPGTGKTTVIVEIILQAIAQHKRVLLTSQTHQAVCNVLEKLHDLKNSGQASVSMVRYAKQEGKLSDLEKKYLAGYNEDEFTSITERSRQSLKELEGIQNSLLHDKEVCEKAFRVALSIEQIEMKREADLRQAEESCQEKDRGIRKSYTERRESEEKTYRGRRSALERQLKSQKDQLYETENQIKKTEKKIAAFSERLTSRHVGSFSDKIFSFTDNLKIFGVQSVENIKKELVSQKSDLEFCQGRRRDLTRDIASTERQIKDCDDSCAALMEQLKGMEEDALRKNNQEKDTRIRGIRNRAYQEIEPLYGHVSIAIRRLQNQQEPLSANSGSANWNARIKALDREIAQKSREIAIKTEWLRDITAFPEAIGRFLNSQVQVFMATCVGLGGWQALQNGTYERFNSDNIDSLVKTKFDLVIIDEAGHATFAETVIPMCFAKKVLLIGDDKQLPPILGDDLPCHANMPLNCVSGVNGQKCDCWFEYSLFSYLWQNENLELPHLMLDTQFRMHPDIGTFISNAFYDRKLKNGTEAKDRLFLFAPFVKPVCVVSTSSRKNRFDESSGTSYVNELEISLVVQTVKALVNSLGSQSSVKQPVSLAVITPYARQVERLRKELAPFFNCTPLLDFSSEHIASVDKFQGSERDIIITSFVRSPKPCPACNGRAGNNLCKTCQGKGHKGGKLTFVQDLKRMNVAFSRARKQLILIGDIDALCKFDGNSEGRDVLKQFYTYVQEKGRVLHIWESEE